LTLEVSGKKAFIMANGVPLLTAMVHLSDGELTLLAMNVSKLVFITYFLSKEHITIFIEC
jgi:hypothetical protein